LPCKVAKFINGDASGDGAVHRAQRILAAGPLDLDVRARRRRGRAPSPIGHTLIVPDRPIHGEAVAAVIVFLLINGSLIQSHGGVVVSFAYFGNQDSCYF